jgi:ArsR family transcriptional regulator, arsenate/arsenite/antimonite-responsive transcriptional repressor / arsenate reductase (thioredoxin)
MDHHSARYCALVAATVTVPALDDPPPFLQLVGHPVRWRLLRELVHSDRAVRELTERLDARQNLVSYHLAQLGRAGIVRSRPSSADRRDRYYAIDLVRCGELLQVSGASLHPALRLVPAPPSTARVRGSARRRPRVLFLCTGNSARSQMAEALITATSRGAIEASSAGSHPKPLHPNAVRVLRDRGIAISHNRTKHLDEFAGQRFDLVVTLCDKVREVCPEFPSQPGLVHWSLADPALSGTTDAETHPAFEALATELETRIRFLLHWLDDNSNEEMDR